MPRLLQALAIGLVGAGIVHLAVALLLPKVAADEAWAQLAAATPPFRFVPADAPGMAVASAPSLFSTSLCRFNLREGTLHVSAERSPLPWFVSIYGSDNRNLASLNDRMISPEQPVDLLILATGQVPEAQEPFEVSPNQTYRIDINATEGLLAFRLFVPDRTWQPAASRFLATLRCEKQVS